LGWLATSRHSLPIARLPHPSSLIGDNREAIDSLNTSHDEKHWREFEQRQEVLRFRRINNCLDALLKAIGEQWDDEYCFQYALGLIQKHYDRWLQENPRPVNTPQYKKQSIGHALRKKVFERDAYRCVACNSYADLSIDHIQAERAGGSLDESNLQTLCRSCNSKKGMK